MALDHERHRGVVVSKSDRYGFIRPDNGGSDIYFHADCLKAAGLDMAVRHGTEVTYEVYTHTSGRTSARSIRPVADDERAELDRWRSARAEGQPVRRFG
jgi:cold shock CspA family protein